MSIVKKTYECEDPPSAQYKKLFALIGARGECERGEITLKIVCPPRKKAAGKKKK